MTTPLRTLPAAVHPGAGETFHSWTTRLSAVLSVEAFTALHAAGYTTTARRRDANLTGYGFTLSDDAAARIAHTTRATPEQMQATLLDVYNGGPYTTTGIDLTQPDAMRRLALREWLHVGTTTACIACLTENGHQWLLPWRLPWTAVCTSHRTLHESICPACGTLFNAGSRPDGTVGPAYAHIRPSTTVCTAATNGDGRRGPYLHPCHHPYADIPTTVCDQPAILTAQERINALLTPGERNHHNPWWTDLRAVTATLLSHATTAQITDLLSALPTASREALAEHYQARDAIDSERDAIKTGGGDHRTSTRQRTQTRTPTDPALIAPIQAVAVAILDDLHVHATTLHRPAPSPLAEGAGLELLREALHSRGKNAVTETRQRGATPTLINALRTDGGYNSLTAHTSTIDYRGFTTDNIPRLWPAHLYQPVATTFRATGTTDDYARAYLALSAAKVLTDGTWADAASALQWDPRLATRCANAVTTRLTSAGQLATIHQHLRHGLTTLVTQPSDQRANYRRLAAKIGQRDRVSRAELHRICDANGWQMQATDAARRNLAIWKWHTQALMPVAEWPGWEHCTNPTSAKEVWRRFATKHVAPAR